MSAKASFGWTQDNFGILSSSWYPLPCVHRLIDGLTASMTRQMRFALAQEAAREVMDVTLRGIYKAMVRAFVSPTLYAKFATKLWQSYYDSGEFKVIIADDGRSADCTIRNWSGHHPFVCDMNIAAATAIYKPWGKNASRPSGWHASTRADRCVVTSPRGAKNNEAARSGGEGSQNHAVAPSSTVSWVVALAM